MNGIKKQKKGKECNKCSLKKSLETKQEKEIRKFILLK